MIIKVLQWPESQKVMNKKGWFFIQSEPLNLVGDSAYAKIIKEDSDFPKYQSLGDEVI